ncbi:hypothetical protein [Phenylobacterium sp.]|uniref:hypothetical protein n=1 Tax=Phenylobacterium sp. TaxID=1871053 RepID=UPI002F9380D5
MRVRAFALAFTALTVIAAAPAAAQAQAASPAAKTAYKAPRTPFGQPDFQGIWTNKTITNLTRDPKLGTRNVLTPAEAEALERATREQVARADAPTPPETSVTDLKNANCGPDGISGFNCGYNQGWKDPGSSVIELYGEKRASIITSPANGQFPPRKAGVQRAANRAMPARTDNPEGFSLGERCLLSFGSSSGPPMLPLMYNNTYNIVQTPDEIVIQVEMVHDVRHIRLNSKHLPPSIKQWMGDSIGWWEGDTLVVETTNFRPEQGLRGGNINQKVTERFTRIGPNKIAYQFKLEDDGYEAPIVGEVAFNRENGMIYEYACHEGNYGLENMLAGARAEEKSGRKVASNASDADGEQ